MDKSKLFAASFETEPVDTDDGTFVVRGLSRTEAMKLRNAADAAETEVMILAAGLVDPALTVAEVRQWLGAKPAGDPSIDAVETAIMRLSKIGTPEVDLEAQFRTGA